MIRVFVFLGVLVLTFGCASTNTTYLQFCDDIDSVAFKQEKIAICPFRGQWEVRSGDSFYLQLPGSEQYPAAICREIEKSRSCLSVVPPEKVISLLPDIEFMIFKHRIACRNMTAFDSLGFSVIHDKTGADYLFFIDRIIFRAQTTQGSSTINTYKTATISYQLWDLNKPRFLYRAESIGEGIDVNGFLKQFSSQSTVTESASEIVKNLPACIKQK